MAFILLKLTAILGIREQKGKNRAEEDKEDGRKQERRSRERTRRR